MDLPHPCCILQASENFLFSCRSMGKAEAIKFRIDWGHLSNRIFHHDEDKILISNSGISLISQMTNISGIYMFVCNIGNACGSLSMLLLAGYLFDNANPFSVVGIATTIPNGNAIL